MPERSCPHWWGSSSLNASAWLILGDLHSRMMKSIGLALDDRGQARITFQSINCGHQGLGIFDLPHAMVAFNLVPAREATAAQNGCGTVGQHLGHRRQRRSTCLRAERPAAGAWLDTLSGRLRVVGRQRNCAVIERRNIRWLTRRLQHRIGHGANV
jgi:hypothetical protein